MTKVMITIRGGVLQSVTSTEPIMYNLVDHDNIEAGDECSTDFVREDFLRTEEDMKLYIDGANLEVIR
jgi:hypothetical protein